MVRRSFNLCDLLTKPAIDLRRPPLYRFPDHTYNINDPTAILYPDDVGHPPWSRLSTSVNEDAARCFLALKDASFFIPLRQHRANAVSVLCGALVLLTILFLSVTRRDPPAASHARYIIDDVLWP